MTSQTSESEHSWLRARLSARLAALLDEVEEARFDAHLSQCGDCREIWESYSWAAPSPETTQHIPRSILARWDRKRVALRGTLRTAVRRHLSSCAECRQDLEFLGVEPTLVEDPALEQITSDVPAPPAEGRVSSSAVEDARFPSTRRAGRPSSGDDSTRGRGVPRSRFGTRPRWLDFGLVGLAGAAAAASVMILAHGATSPTTVGDALVPWVAPDRLRGGASRSTLRIEDSARAILLRVGVPVDFPPGSAAIVEVTDPGGMRILQASVPSTEVERRTVMVLLRSPGPFAPGGYRVCFKPANASGQTVEPVDTFFDLELRAP